MLLMFLFIIPIAGQCNSSPFTEIDNEQVLAAQSACPVKCISCQEFNELNSKIRDGTIQQSLAKKRVAELLPEIRRYYYEEGEGRDYPKKSCVFPVEGYDSRAIGGRKNHGYVAAGYNYFDGNRHGGHPSHDIFIQDRNRDQLDDHSKKPVRVLSISGGIVVASETEWDVKSPLRGGIYVWIYTPSDESLVYYAHNREILVNVGDIVRPGDTIAVVGRTGLNAHKRRSPTHLHITYMKIEEGHPVPVNIYSALSGYNIKQRGKNY